MPENQEIVESSSEYEQEVTSSDEYEQEDELSELSSLEGVDDDAESSDLEIDMSKLSIGEKKREKTAMEIVMKRLEENDKRFMKEAIERGEVDKDDNDLVDTSGKKIRQEKKQGTREEINEDEEDFTQPTQKAIPVLIKPPTKATKADIIYDIKGMGRNVKTVKDDLNVDWTGNEEIESESDESGEEEEEEDDKMPSIQEIEKQKFQRMNGGNNNDPNSKALVPRGSTMPPECWWCLYGDRDVERVDADAFHLFEQGYDRYLTVLPKEQLAYFLHRLWYRLIYLPSLEEGKCIPLMTPEMFLIHMDYHNKDPKYA